MKRHEVWGIEVMADRWNHSPYHSNYRVSKSGGERLKVLPEYQKVLSGRVFVGGDPNICPCCDPDTKELIGYHGE